MAGIDKSIFSKFLLWIKSYSLENMGGVLASHGNVLRILLRHPCGYQRKFSNLLPAHSSIFNIQILAWFITTDFSPWEILFCISQSPIIPFCEGKLKRSNIHALEVSVLRICPRSREAVTKSSGTYKRNMYRCHKISYGWLLNHQELKHKSCKKTQQGLNSWVCKLGHMVMRLRYVMTGAGFFQGDFSCPSWDKTTFDVDWTVMVMQWAVGAKSAPIYNTSPWERRTVHMIKSRHDVKRKKPFNQKFENKTS